MSELTLSFILIFTVHIQSESIYHVVEKLQEEFDIYTLLHFASNGTFDVLNLPNLPQVVIGNETAADLRRSQGQRVLSFIRLDEIGLGELDEIVKPSLLNLHLADILFYTNATWSEANEWQWLFEWCWLEGFWRILLMNEVDQFLSMDCIPEMSIRSVTLNEYLTIRKNRVKNLQGYPVKVAIGHSPPRVSAFLMMREFYNWEASMVPL